MKGNIKKLVVFVMIAAIAMFAVIATASADPPGNLRGQYAGTGSGTCLLAPFGFDPTAPGVPKYAALGAWTIQTFNSEGVWTFNGDGTGSVKALGRFVTLAFTEPNPSPPPPTITVPPSAGEQTTSYLFHYTVTDDGIITVTADPGTYVTTWIYGPSNGNSYHIDGYLATGTIAPDGKTITLNRGVPNVMNFIGPSPGLPPGAQLFCNQSSVLIWEHDGQ